MTGITACVDLQQGVFHGLTGLIADPVKGTVSHTCICMPQMYRCMPCHICPTQMYVLPNVFTNIDT